MHKPGWKTSEFWLATIPVVLGAVMASGILDDTPTAWDNKLVGLAVSVLAALGYGAARTVGKIKASKEQP